jgi:hypothetical protein
MQLNPGDNPLYHPSDDGARRREPYSAGLASGPEAERERDGDD